METNLIKKIGLEETDEPNFIKMYFNDISRLYDLSKSATVLFYESLKLVTYNPQDSIHNVVFFTNTRKKEIYKKLTTNIDTAYNLFAKAKKELISKKIFIKLEDDTYLVDPAICSKTNWANTEVLRSITLKVTYEGSMRTLVTLVESQPEKIKELVEIKRSENL